MELKKLSDDELRMELNGVVEILDLVMEEMHKDAEEAEMWQLIRRFRETYYPIFEKITHDLTVLNLRFSLDR